MSTQPVDGSTQQPQNGTAPNPLPASVMGQHRRPSSLLIGNRPPLTDSPGSGGPNSPHAAGAANGHAAQVASPLQQQISENLLPPQAVNAQMYQPAADMLHGRSSMSNLPLATQQPVQVQQTMTPPLTRRQDQIPPPAQLPPMVHDTPIPADPTATIFTQMVAQPMPGQPLATVSAPPTSAQQRQAQPIFGPCGQVADAQDAANIRASNALYMQMMNQYQMQKLKDEKLGMGSPKQQPNFLPPGMIAPLNPVAPVQAPQQGSNNSSSDKAVSSIDTEPWASQGLEVPLQSMPLDELVAPINWAAPAEAAPAMPQEQAKGDAATQIKPPSSPGWQTSVKPNKRPSETFLAKPSVDVTEVAAEGSVEKPVMALSPNSIQTQLKMHEVRRSFLAQRQAVVDGRSSEDASGTSPGDPERAGTTLVDSSSNPIQSQASVPPAGNEDQKSTHALKISLSLLTFGSLREKATPDIEYTENFEVTNTSVSETLMVEASIPPLVGSSGETVLKIEPKDFSLLPGMSQKMVATFMTSCTTTIISEVVFTCTRSNAAAVVSGTKAQEASCTIEDVVLPIKVESALSSSLDISEFMFTGDLNDSSLSELRTVKATWRGQDCLVTVVKRTPDHTGSTWNRYVHETRTLEKLRSPYILYCFGAIRSPTQFCMVTESIATNNLFEEIRKEPLTPVQMVRFALDIGRALCFSHAAGIVHKNVTPENVLVLSRDIHCPVCCKLTNFGLSRDFSRIEEGEFGDEVYMAPEVLLHRGGCTPAVDTFSYALVLWYLAAGVEPFAGEDFAKNYRSLIAQGKRLEIPSTCLPDLAAMIQICWQQNPQDRPEFSQIVFILEPLFWQLKTVEDAHASAKASQPTKTSLFGWKKK